MDDERLSYVLIFDYWSTAKCPVDFGACIKFRAAQLR